MGDHRTIDFSDLASMIRMAQHTSASKELEERHVSADAPSRSQIAQWIEVVMCPKKIRMLSCVALVIPTRYRS
jgi:hypothetical protein